MRVTTPRSFKLPSEILLHIFEYLAISSRKANLVNSALVCKLWFSLAESVLYRDLALSHLDRFLVHSAPRNDTHVHSLTICAQLVEPRTTGFSDDEKWDQKIRDQKIRFSLGPFHLRAPWKLSDRVKAMTRLSSFSIVQARDTYNVVGFWPSQSTLANLIDNLPPSCSNLEIDAMAEPELSSKSGHLCPAVRKILPQLKYLRLRLRSVCPNLFGTGFDVAHPQEVSGTFEPVEAPHLKEMVINLCSRTGDRLNLVCREAHRSDHKGVHHAYYYPEARITMTVYLRRALESSCYPNLDRIWVVDRHWRAAGSRGFDSYPAYYRRDIAANRSQVFPYKNFGKPNPAAKPEDMSFIRTTDGDYVSPQWAHPHQVEEECWQESLQGVRLPKPVMDASAHIPRGLPQETYEDWSLRTNESSDLRANEELAGMRLLEVGDIEGLTGVYTVKESVPQGFQRIKRRLHRI